MALPVGALQICASVLMNCTSSANQISSDSVVRGASIAGGALSASNSTDLRNLSKPSTNLNPMKYADLNAMCVGEDCAESEAKVRISKFLLGVLGDLYAVGKEIGIFWWDAQIGGNSQQVFGFNYYMRAQILSFDTNSGLHTISYPDGEEECIKISEHAFFFVDIERLIVLDLPEQYRNIKDKLCELLEQVRIPAKLKFGSDSTAAQSARTSVLSYPINVFVPYGVKSSSPDYVLPNVNVCFQSDDALDIVQAVLLHASPTSQRLMIVKGRSAHVGLVFASIAELTAFANVAVTDDLNSDGAVESVNSHLYLDRMCRIPIKSALLSALQPAQLSIPTMFDPTEHNLFLWSPLECLLASDSVFTAWLRASTYSLRNDSTSAIAKLTHEVLTGIADACAHRASPICLSCQTLMSRESMTCSQCKRKWAPVSSPPPASAKHQSSSASTAVNAPKSVSSSTLVQQFLADCGLGAAESAAFEAQGIRDSDLPLLTEADVHTLLPGIGPRRRVWQALCDRRATADQPTEAALATSPISPAQSQLLTLEPQAKRSRRWAVI